MSDTTESHRDFRPDYWDPADPLTALIANVKGAKRREMIRDIVTGRARELVAERGGSQLLQAMMSEVMDDLLVDELEDPGELSGIHPHFLGGEFLPTYESGEVEIARITLRSTTMDVVAIRARRPGGRISYGVVDEYSNDFTFEPEHSEQSLTFGEMIQFIDSIDEPDTQGTRRGQGYVNWIRDSYVEFGAEPDNMSDFVTVSSPFYPALQAYYEERAREWYVEQMM